MRNSNISNQTILQINIRHSKYTIYGEEGWRASNCYKKLLENQREAGRKECIYIFIVKMSEKKTCI